MSTRTIPGQGVLPEMLPTPRTDSLNVKERAAVGRLLGPRALTLLGVNPESLADITDADLETVNPEDLRESLYSDYGMQIGGIAVNEDEYQAIPGYSRGLRLRAEAKTTRARKIDTNEVRSAAAMHRSVGHTLKTKEESSEGIFTWLASEKERLSKLNKELHGYPGHAHMNQGDLLVLIRGVIDFSFMNIIGVVAKQRDLEPAQKRRMEIAVQYNLTSLPKEERAKYLKDMTALALEYNSRRTAIFRNRVKIAHTEAANANKKAAKLTK